MWASFLYLFYSFLSLTSIILSFVFSVAQSIFRVLLMCDFLPASPLLRHFHFFHQTLVLIYGVKLTFTELLWQHIQRVFRMVVVSTFPQWAIFSVTTFTFDLNFTPCYYFLILCCSFIFVGQFPLPIIHFCKMPRGFIIGRRGGNNTVYAWTE